MDIIIVYLDFVQLFIFLTDFREADFCNDLYLRQETQINNKNIKMFKFLTKCSMLLDIFSLHCTQKI